MVFCQTPYVPFNWVSVVVDRQATEAMDNYSDGASPERKNLTDLTTGNSLELLCTDPLLCKDSLNFCSVKA